MNDHVEVNRTAAPDGCSTGARVLAVYHGGVEIRLLLLNCQHVLITGSTSTVTILNEHPVLSLLAEIHHSGWIPEMAVERVDAVTEVVQFVDAIALVINDNDIRIGMAVDPFAINVKPILAAFGDFEFKPVGVASLVKPATDNQRQRDLLRFVLRIVGFDFERYGRISHHECLRIGKPAG